MIENNGKPWVESPPLHIKSDDVCIHTLLERISEKFTSSIIGIDAPLSKPENGAWRECENKLHGLGISCFPSGAEWTREWVEKGINLKKWAENQLDATVIEVYPYAARKAFGIGINEKIKKKTKAGRRVIQDGLSELIEGLNEITKDMSKDTPLTDDELDALLSAYIAYCKVNGNFKKLDGKDGTIYLPLKRI